MDSEIQANVDYCYVRRRAECTSLGPGLKHPSLRSHSCLSVKRRAEALHVVFFFNKASEPSKMSCFSVYSRVIRTRRHERRALGALLSLSLGPSPRRPTAGCSLAAVRRGDCFRAFCIRSPTHRSVLVILCGSRTAAVPGRLCSVRFLLH